MADFSGKDLLSTEKLSRAQIDRIFQVAEEFLPIARKEKSSNLLEGKVMAALFYEPSTRTRLSFETAMQRLGGRVVSVVGMDNSSLVKGETLYDTAKVVENYADVIAMRHNQVGSVDEVARGASVPVINAGDGIGEHPTQALLDIFTMQKERGKLDGLTIALVGDLLYGRTVHSLIHLLAHFKVKLILVSPKQLKMPVSGIDFLERKNIEFTETEDLEYALGHAQILYMTRIQKERFTDMAEYEKFKNCYVLTRASIEKHDAKMTIMHPLPRVGEISLDVDDLPGAAYFRQVQNGVAVRMAILALVLGKV